MDKDSIIGIMKKIRIPPVQQRGMWSVQHHDVAGQTQVVLRRHGIVWMSDNETERKWMGAASAHVKEGNRVLVGGLGLGVFPQFIEDKAAEIVVVERSVAVIKMVWDAVAAPNWTLQHGDVYEYIDHSLGRDQDRFDFVFLDTWDHLDQEYLLRQIQPYKQKANRVLKPDGTVVCWGEYRMIRTLRTELIALLDMVETDPIALTPQKVNGMRYRWPVIWLFAVRELVPWKERGFQKKPSVDGFLKWYLEGGGWQSLPRKIPGRV